MERSKTNGDQMNKLPTEYPFTDFFQFYLRRLRVFFILIAANLALVSFGFLIVKAPSLVLWLGLALVGILILFRIGGVRLTVISLVVANVFLGIGFLIVNAPSLILWLVVALIPILAPIRANRLDRILVSFLFGPTG
jgi:hypothetical protein